MRIKRIISAILISACILTALPFSASSPTMEYNGSGMTIAVLDYGFDLSHESFTLTTTAASITKEHSDSLIASTSAGKDDSAPKTLYVSEKIPFAYDYGDRDADVSQLLYAPRGTAMISIAAGNGKKLAENVPGATGIAPEAQILAMKVYSDAGLSVSARAMRDAINDSIILGADVILVAVSSMNGLGSAKATDEVNAAIARAEALGIPVITGAGNNIKYGSGSVIDDEYSIHLPLTSNPDTGTIAWPGNLDFTFTVGSADTNIVESDFFTLPSGKQIPYGDSNHMFPSAAESKTFASYFNDKTLEYVVSEGIGKPEELAAAGDLNGKLVLIRRGELTFTEKATNAAALGAIGIIVEDNQIDKNLAVQMLMDLTDAPIPAIIVSDVNGQLLRSESDKHIAVKSGETFKTYLSSTKTPTDDSAHGTTATLGLKPDITAIGTYVECAAVNNGYTSLSSTLGAAARVTGMYVCVKARMAQLRPSLDNAALMKLTRAALVSTAELMLQRSSSMPHSPRIQGGGSADLDAALNCGIVLTSSGSHKLELGDGFGSIITFKITAENLTDTAKTCTLDAIVGSDGYDDLTASHLGSDKQAPLYEKLGYAANDTMSFITSFTPLPDVRVALGDGMYQLNEVSAGYEPFSITIGAGKSETFNVVIIIEQDIFNTYSEKFPNGFFIEGFMRMRYDDKAVSLPLLGFVGNYSDAPSLDASIYDGKQHLYSNTYLYRFTNDASSDTNQSILGGKLVDGAIEYSMESFAFSTKNGRDYAPVMLNFGLLRSIRDVIVTVTDADGNTVKQTALGDLMRTYVSISTGTPVSPQIELWDGSAHDNPAYTYPDGEYTVTVSFKTIGKDTPHELLYRLTLDKTPPSLDSYEFVNQGSESRTLKLEVSDNHIISDVNVVDSEGTAGDINDDGSWDVSYLHGKYIYIEIYDTASNMTVERIKNPSYDSVS